MRLFQPSTVPMSPAVSLKIRRLKRFEELTPRH